jgi:hypothetical protein
MRRIAYCVLRIEEKSGKNPPLPPLEVRGVRWADPLYPPYFKGGQGGILPAAHLNSHGGVQ